MTCSPFDLKDYVFNELRVEDARTVEGHLASCTGCREELERLRLTHAALVAVPDEEMPRRIAFVSDKVFEPSFWQRLWQSGPRLGFLSAAMLSLAILTHAVIRPAAPAMAPPTTAMDDAAIEKRVEAEVARRLPAAIERVAAEVARQQRPEFVRIVEGAEKRIELQRRSDQLALEENWKLLSGKLNRIERDSYSVASVSLWGGAVKGLVALLLVSCVATATEPVRISRATFAGVERAFDQTLQRPIESPFNVIGTTRGIYIGGFGAVLTAEINLIVGPTISPFKPEITKQEIAALKQRKLERVPYLKQIMRKMLVNFAAALDSLPPDEQIVLGVSLFNFRWEDSAGLPTQIIMQATRKALLTAGANVDQASIKVQEY